VVLASEGRKFTPEAIDLAERLAKTAGSDVHVLSIARIWGSALGLPHPGLKPTKRELEDQHALVADAVMQLKRRGIAADGQIIGTRAAARRIVGAAMRRGAGVIVMGADPPKHWLVADLLWSQEPYRVRRLADIPVYTVVDRPQS
jgi:nucleotide-binding universal stress UspA family protein